MLEVKYILKVDQHHIFVKSKRDKHFTCSIDLFSRDACISKLDLVAFFASA